MTYYKPELDSNKMQEIRLGLENGLTKTQIESIANAHISHRDMAELRQYFEALNFLEK